MRFDLLGLVFSVGVLAAAPFYASQNAPKQPSGPVEIKLARKYCIRCHSGADPAAGIDLSKFRTEASILKARDAWDKVAQNVASGHMPPEGAPHPSDAERSAMVAAIQTALSADCKLADPGRVTIRRLNRAEYDNTIRDLVGVEFRPADDFPSDDVGYGFDDIGDVLSISPLLMEKYLSAAEQVAQKAIHVPCVKVARYDGSNLESSQTETDSGGRELFTNGEAYARCRFEGGSRFRIRVRAWGQQAGPEPCKMAIKLDGKVLDTFEVRATQGRAANYEVPIHVEDVDRHKVAAAFLNDYYNPTAEPQDRDRNLFIDYIEVEGPLDSARLIPESQRRLIPFAPKDPMADGRKMLASFATKAFRRPVTSDEMDRVMKVFALSQKSGDPFERSMQLGVEAILTSPYFLFRVEIDPKPNDPHASRLLDGYELATRLSYFLWSSTPDDELRSLAGLGKLQRPEVLTHEVARMLQDPKAAALTDNFAGQWLQLRKLATVAIDPEKYKDFDEDLRRAMITETKMFFDSVRRNDRSVIDFLDGKYTFVDGALAKHYGIPGVTGDAFRKVALTDGRRGGILTQASVLTVTSNPTRTSPTKRGKWILEQILGTPPPPPPPGVSSLGDEKKITSAETLRKLMEEHRAKPMCASCHARMDPLGFGLENFDATGAWRDRDGATPIDSSGTLPDGRVFHGPAELRTILLARKKDFVRSLSEKLLTYALGRGLEAYDKCATDEIVKRASADGYRFSTLIKSIVLSDPFRKRRGDGGLQ